MLTNREVEKLASDLELALIAEYMAKTDAARQRAVADGRGMRIISEAYADKTIDGKNADIRRGQEAAVLLNDSEYLSLLRNAELLEFHAATAEAERKAHEALIGLTKAWLYSQSGE